MLSRPVHDSTASFDCDLRSLSLAWRNLARSPRATRRSVLAAELSLRNAQLVRVLDELGQVHALRRTVLTELEALGEEVPAAA